MPQAEPLTLTSEDGIRLAGIWHTPEIPSGKAVVLAHGITVDKDESGVFVKLAESLAADGYAVLRFDFRGHGQSGGTLSIAGEVLDIQAAVREVRSRGVHNVGLLGASFGGGSSVLYTSAHQGEITSLVLWNPVLDYDHTFLHPTLPWIIESVGHMREDIERQGWTLLGSRKFRVERSVFREMETLFPYAKLADIDIPTLIVHGTADTKVPYDDSVRYGRALPHGRLETVLGAEHGFKEPEAYAAAEKYVRRFFSETL